MVKLIQMMMLMRVKMRIMMKMLYSMMTGYGDVGVVVEKIMRMLVK